MREGMTHSTVLHNPSSMAAAARQTMPTELAPPRSTTSAKSMDTPRYSAAMAGTNMPASWNCGPMVMSPSTSFSVRPASSSACRPRSATCSK